MTPERWEQVGQLYEAVLERPRNERTAFVNADPDLLYKDVVEIIDVAKGAGVDKVGLMTEQIQAGK